MASAPAFGIINWSLTLISIFLFLILFILFLKIRNEQREKDISLYLTMNTCLAGFLTSSCVLAMVSSNVFKPFLLRNIDFCYIFGLFYDIFECAIYYSYCLQSFYRLCRIIYYKVRFLLSWRFYRVLILIQWFITIILLLPTLFLKWYIHLPGESYCLIPYDNLIGSFYLILVLYSIPLITMIVIYIWITRYIRTRTNIRATEKQRNLRDFTAIKRIIVCVLILISLRFPTIAFIFYGIGNGYLFIWTYAIVGLVTATCLIFIALMSISMTNKFKKLVSSFFIGTNNQVQPRTGTNS
ncbi:unnamed protein product [Adineta ricciae]|uniref:G-protein coupled receptors family 1 profile domain-containing protein n=1 Tax=Adineta ricciae TaxID=249248 RepID=A0A815MEG0_ADIRI|nr:unnamed protein product [Adineta ricciae]CAF1422186.1 unnamed protein product [Adineta ricciae]